MRRILYLCENIVMDSRGKECSSKGRQQPVLVYTQYSSNPSPNHINMNAMTLFPNKQALTLSLFCNLSKKIVDLEYVVVL
jgi:hypothetical protein